MADVTRDDREAAVAAYYGPEWGEMGYSATLGRWVEGMTPNDSMSKELLRIAQAIADAREQGRAEERARIVAWLRGGLGLWSSSVIREDAAQAFERGEHWKEGEG